MKVVRIVDPDSVRPLHVVMVCLFAATLAGSCLLTSGPNAAIEGSQDWREESPLRAIVHVLNVSYTQTTALGVEIKWLVFGIGAAAAAAAFGLSLVVPSLTQEEATVEDTVVQEPPAGGAGVNGGRRGIPSLWAAQLLMVAYVLWSFLSTQWSTAPDLALGGSILLAIGVLWSLALGLGLNRPTANVSAYVLIAVCAVTGLLAIAYYGERNPTRRAQYPLGNPLILAACLIPGFLLAVSVLCTSLRALTRRLGAVHWVPVLLSVAAGGLMVWTVRLTGSRSGALAAVCGLMALVFFVVRGRTKIAVAMGAVAISIAAVWFYVLPQFSAPSPTGRDASLRLRAYAWAYADNLISESKIVGHGQGGFTRFGDAYAAQDDVEADPLALKDRIAHAHNEWLEVWSDLGMVGFVLLLGALGRTFRAGMSALRRLPNGIRRWTLAGLLASLVALMVEECASVGLRLAGLPAVFYSVLGLVWAMSREPGMISLGRLGGSLWSRRPAGIAGIAVGIVLLTASIGDFQSARAYFEVSPALQSGSFDDAVQLAERACRGRLSPQRRLKAYERLCSTHLYIARKYQSLSLDRYAKAQQSDPADANLIRLAGLDRERCETHIAAARGACKGLVRRSPGYWDAGWLEMRLWQLRSVYADVDGDVELAARAATAARDALKRELKRRPFNSIIALNYVGMVSDQMTLEQRFDIIARPLRYAPIPREYAEYLMLESNAEAFDSAFPMMTRVGQRAVATGGAIDDPFIPEKMRLAARVHSIRDHYELAVQAAQAALLLYDWVAPEGPMGKAVCSYELAEYQFYLDPMRWDRAVEHAKRAIALLPDSTPGRQMVHVVEDRMVTYYLAGGDESSARELLTKHEPGRPDGVISSELGSRYAVFCRSLIRGRRKDFPEGFERWVQRARELDPGNELAWRLAAQVAFDRQQFSESVDDLRRALSHGADPSVIYAFVRLALSEHSQDPNFAALEDELRAFLQPNGEQAPAGGTSGTGIESTSSRAE